MFTAVGKRGLSGGVFLKIETETEKGNGRRTGYNILRGPECFTADTALRKISNFAERQSLQTGPIR
jgi:hypothetical protein